MFNFLKLLIRHQTREPVGDETLDRTVPLDGHDLARLINLRVARSRDCDCDHCADFLSEIQFKGRPAREHANEVFARRFWNHSIGSYEPSPEDVQTEFTPDESFVYQAHGSAIDKLIQAEKKWQDAHTSKCVDSDDYWIRHCKEIHSDKDASTEALETQGYHI